MVAFTRYTGVEYTHGDGLTLQVNPEVPDIGDHQLDVSFSVAKSMEANANTAQVVVMNLPETERKRIEGDNPTFTDFDLPGAFVDRRLGVVPGAAETARTLGVGYLRLFAGYADQANPSASTLFEGQVRQARTASSGADFRTTFECGDAEVNLSAASLNRSFGPRTSFVTLVRYIVETLNLKLSSDSDPERGGVLPPALVNGFTVGNSGLYGDPVQWFNTLAHGIGFQWFVEDGEVVILGPDGYRGAGIRTVRIGRDNVIGTPAKIGPSRLSLRIRIESGVKLGTQAILTPDLLGEGFRLRVEEVVHIGRNRGGRYETQLTLQNLDVLQSV